MILRLAVKVINFENIEHVIQRPENSIIFLRRMINNIKLLIYKRRDAACNVSNQLIMKTQNLTIL
jgi:hypothetical protein